MLSRLLLLGTLLGPSLADVEYAKVECTPAGDIYEYSAGLLDGSGTVSFEDYRGKVILIYNSNCPFISDTFRDGTYYSPLQVGDVHWNFEKFLLGRDGRVYYRYNPTTYDAKDLIPDIEYLLSVNTTTTI
ncbi:hypothetical protein Anas_06157 [Armadillidium nasatum]|uniref:Uncharacterized protein n=1 Tax=Armadillidium nasatum TaxID=96803 RepID=A0A5N5SU19_9CRUS|nr:hypothetical protein Anas_06157 [Armadillidium nasatum]